MKRILFVVSLLLLTATQLSAQMLVGSYNIRYKNNGDSINGNVWAKRCQVICDQVNFMSPDIIGTQEVLCGQLQDMLSLRYHQLCRSESRGGEDRPRQATGPGQLLAQ